MIRNTFSVPRHKRHKKLLKKARSYFAGSSRTFKVAKEAVDHAKEHATVSRNIFKRDIRRLWISRINGFARIELNTTYSEFINKINGRLNRKDIADLISRGQTDLINLLYKDGSLLL